MEEIFGETFESRKGGGMKDVKKLSHLLKLLEDESGSVQQAVLKELYCYGPGLEDDIQLFYPEYAEQAHPSLQKVLDIHHEQTFSRSCKASLENNTFLTEIETIDAALQDTQSIVFTPGTLVRHTRYEYRGVVVDLDPFCRAKETWYQSNQTRPDKEQPWYYILVHSTDKVTYVAHMHLSYDQSGEQVLHPLRDYFFDSFRCGSYPRNRRRWAKC